MLIQLSSTVHVDPTSIIGVVRNRSESSALRATRLYVHDGRTVTVDREPVDVVAQIEEAIGRSRRVHLVQLGSQAWFYPAAICAIVANRNARSYHAGRRVRLYIGLGQRSRTVTVDYELNEVVGTVQAAQNPQIGDALGGNVDYMGLSPDPDIFPA